MPTGATLTINVTVDDIAGEQHHAERCPIASVVKRQNHDAHEVYVWSCGMWMLTDDSLTAVTCKLDERGDQFRRAYDFGMDVRPKSFTTTALN